MAISHANQHVRTLIHILAIFPFRTCQKSHIPVWSLDVVFCLEIGKAFFYFESFLLHYSSMSFCSIFEYRLIVPLPILLMFHTKTTLK